MTSRHPVPSRSPMVSGTGWTGAWARVSLPLPSRTLSILGVSRTKSKDKSNAVSAMWH